MPNASHPASHVGRRRMPVWIGMASWFYLARMGGGMSAMGGGASEHAGMAMGGDGLEALVTAFAMWAVMMTAMMLPTVAPSAVVFSSLAARRDPGRGDRATALYVAGYGGAWIAFAAPAASMQWALTHYWLLDPMGQSTSALLSSAILLAAGAYQFTPLKSACLSKCRTPLGFLMAEWRDGASGAFRLGLHHGGYCVACCWTLMAVMFVVGAMNLVWMAMLTLLVLCEKIVPARWRLDRAVGVTLLGLGAWLAVGAY
ncbi:MAG: DUF2182 domain-containing protein, partial [Burkholderiaceae bacterium]